LCANLICWRLKLFEDEPRAEALALDENARCIVKDESDERDYDKETLAQKLRRMN
jgi:hypothetical protein